MDRIKQVIEAKYPNVQLNKWIETQPKTITFEELWQCCDNGGWMLYLASQIGVDLKLVVLAACACVEPVLRYVPAEEENPNRAIVMARLWAAGKVTDKACINAGFDAMQAGERQYSKPLNKSTQQSDACFAACYPALIPAVWWAADCAIFFAVRARLDMPAYLKDSAEIVRSIIPSIIVEAALDKENA